MVFVKRIYSFMLQQFLPLLAMTFFICLFIVMMQFLWRFVDDIVGKGLSFNVIAELFFYAGLSMVPTALPLAILLASLMTFGNLGEKFELTAIKAAGISLFRIMKPLIVLMVFIATGAFFFQNEVLPVAQTKMWTLIFSMRQKSPEVEIPERSFYNQVPGFNFYVQRKDRDTGMLYDVIIYKNSDASYNSKTQVIRADSALMSVTQDNKYLYLKLYNGVTYDSSAPVTNDYEKKKNDMFTREDFDLKDIYIESNSNFDKLDEGLFSRQYIGKNVKELSYSIDSLQNVVDSIGDVEGRILRNSTYVNVPSYTYSVVDSVRVDVPVPAVAMEHPLDIDSIFAGPSPSVAKNYIAQATNKAKNKIQNIEFRTSIVTETEKLRNRHGIELHRRFTLSFACLIFFFIGAPLGAIIKKGGLGTPLVISVFLFIFYYIVDNMGYKMARDGKLPVWEGIWLSSAVLLPLGVFFTYKAVGDSAVFNPDAYINFFNRLRGKQMKRSLSIKEVIMTEVETPQAIAMVEGFVASATSRLTAFRSLSLLGKLFRKMPLDAEDQAMNDIVDYLSNSRDKRVMAYINEYPMRLNYRNLAYVINNSEKLLKYLQDPENAPDIDNANDEPASKAAHAHASAKEAVKLLLAKLHLPRRKHDAIVDDSVIDAGPLSDDSDVQSVESPKNTSSEE